MRVYKTIDNKVVIETNSEDFILCNYYHDSFSSGRIELKLENSTVLIKSNYNTFLKKLDLAFILLKWAFKK